MKFTDLFDAEFICIETFRKNGKGVKTPTWQTPKNGNLYVWTLAHSGKVKRIRNNNQVKVCRCDRMGNPLSEWVEACAYLLDSDAAKTQQKQRLEAKYGEQIKQFALSETQGIVIEIKAKTN